MTTKNPGIASSSPCIVPGQFYGAKVITAELLDIFLFLAYSVIDFYFSFLMRLIEIIKTLILLFIVYSVVYSVTITRLAKGCTPLLWPQLLLCVL